MPKTILSFGETLWDLMPSGPRLGGAPFNLAWRLHELGERAAIATALGRDGLGDKAFAEIVQLGMDTRFIDRDASLRTGMVEVTHDADHNPIFRILPGAAYEAIEPSADLLGFAASADALTFGTLAQRSDTSRNTLRQLLDAAPNALAFYDINLRPECWTAEIVDESLRRAHVAQMNLDEAHTLREVFGIESGAAADFCVEIARRWNLKACIVTMRGRGSMAYAPGGSEPNPVFVPGYRVEVVDTTGSGDAFAAGFLHHYLRGEPLGECCRFGNALGALAATRQGATAPIETREIDALLQHPAPPLDRAGLDAFLGGEEEYGN